MILNKKNRFLTVIAIVFSLAYSKQSSALVAGFQAATGNATAAVPFAIAGLGLNIGGKVIGTVDGIVGDSSYFGSANAGPNSILILLPIIGEFVANDFAKYALFEEKQLNVSTFFMAVSALAQDLGIVILDQSSFPQFVRIKNDIPTVSADAADAYNESYMLLNASIQDLSSRWDSLDAEGRKAAFYEIIQSNEVFALNQVVKQMF